MRDRGIQIKFETYNGRRIRQQKTKKLVKEDLWFALLFNTVLLLPVMCITLELYKFYTTGTW